MSGARRIGVAALALLGAVGAYAARSDMPDWSEREVAAITSHALTALGPPPPDPSNRVADDPRGAALGAALFADPRLSASGRVSCATCHQSTRDFQDGRPLGVGAGTTARRTMTVVGTAYTPWLFWDGRADSQWAQALGPLESAVEHGGTRTLYVRVLAGHHAREYAALFGALPDTRGLPRDAGPLGSPAERRAWLAMPATRRDSVTRAFVNVGKSIAAFERTLGHPPTRFDRYAAALAAGARPRAGEILSADEAAGLRLFVGRAQCATCHTGPRFTDDPFHNTGVPAAPGLPPDDGRIAGAEAARADPFNCLGPYGDADRAAGTARSDRAASARTDAARAAAARALPDDAARRAAARRRVRTERGRASRAAARHRRADGRCDVGGARRTRGSPAERLTLDR